LQVTGEYFFDAPRDRVWATMLEPASLRACIPGCESLTETGDRAYDMTLKVGIASINGVYAGTVRVEDVNPEDSYRLVVSGKGKPGSVNGNGTLTFTPDGNRTRVQYVGAVSAQGAISRMGNRLLGSAAKLLIGRFMKAMETRVADRDAGGDRLAQA
jgi:uncharacterized protein